MKIPKNIHQIWLGDNIIPTLFIKLAKTWKNKNVGWNYTFYDNHKINDFLFKYHSNLIPFYNSLTYNIQRVDFLKYLILREFGGVYVDLDFVCLKSIDEIMNNKDFVLPIEPHSHANHNGFDTLIGNCFIGSTINNRFLELFIDDIILKSNTLSEDINDKYNYVMKSTGPIALTNFYENYQNKSNIELLSHALLCPLDAGQARDYYGNPSEKYNERLKESYAVHLFCGTWL